MVIGERKTFLDKLRILATCAVVFLHTLTGAMNNAAPAAFPGGEKSYLILMDIICWCVPVFLMISGYIFLHPCWVPNLRIMATKYCSRILLALLFFGVPYACIERIATEKRVSLKIVGNSFLDVLRGQSWAHMWYLYALLILYLITPILHRLMRILPKCIIFILIGILFLGCSVFPCLVAILPDDMSRLPILPDWVVYFLYYINGSVFSQYLCPDTATQKNKKINTILRWCYPLAIVAVLTTIIVSRFAGFTVLMGYNYPLTVILSTLLFGCAQCWEQCLTKQNTQAVDPRSKQHSGSVTVVNHQRTGRWENTAKLCFGIYLVHPVFLNFCYKFLHITPFTVPFPIWASLPVFFVCTLLLASITTWILRKIPFMRKRIL